jgi:hypothetical protein
MTSGLPDAFEGGGLLGRFSVQLGEFFKKREGDLLNHTVGFFEGGEPAIEVLRPVQDHRLNIILSKYNLQVVAAGMPSCRSIEIAPASGPRQIATNYLGIAHVTRGGSQAAKDLRRPVRRAR